MNPFARIFTARPLRWVLLWGLLIRTASLFWGTPVLAHGQLSHPDEPKVYSMAADFPRVYVSDARYLQYGTAISYTLGLLLYPLKAVLVGLGGRPEAYRLTVWLLLRLVSVFLGVATIILANALTEELGGRRAGLLAGAFLSVSFYHAMNSSFATLDVPMGCLLMAAVLLGGQLFEQGNVKKAVLFGLVVGFLGGTKITGWLILIAPLILWLLPSTPGNKAEQGLWLLVSLLIALAVFALYQPHWLINPARYIQVFQEAKASWVDRSAVSVQAVLSRWYDATAAAIGIPVAVLAVFGAVVLFARPESRSTAAALVGLIGAYYLFWARFLLPRFLIPVAPLLCCLAAVACDAVMRRASTFTRWLAWSAVALSIGWSCLLCGLGLWMRLHDPRPDAARYLAENYPPGTRVALTMNPGSHRLLSSKAEEGRFNPAFGESAPGVLWVRHGWQYPRIDGKKFVVVDIREQPDLIVYSRPAEPLLTVRLSDSGMRYAGYRLVYQRVLFPRVGLDFAPPDVFIYARNVNGSSASGG